MDIIRPTCITEKMVEAISQFLPQLISGSAIPDTEYLQEMIENGSSIFFAIDGDSIIGTLTLAIYKIPTGKKAWIEDVIVDSRARGKGVAQRLIEAALEYAWSQGLVKVDLTSSNFRESAHQLYYKVGFEKRDTSVFRKMI